LGTYNREDAAASTLTLGCTDSLEVRGAGGNSAGCDEAILAMIDLLGF